MSKEITTAQFLKEFDRAVILIGGTAKAARYWSLSESFVRSVKSGVNLPGRKILNTMGYESIKEIKYRYRLKGE